MPPQSDMPDLFVVDGSNLATEGREKPSLAGLDEAVAAFRETYPGIKLTVVVDATFGHRIAKKEVAAFDKRVASNEIVTPPAGAIGRGDAFILAIADKAGAGVLSNDSFQEFHGEYGWLFEHGRLIGGKPVPHVGWVFVDRNPVRGPKSRAAVKAARSKESGSPTDAKEQANRRVSKKSAARKTKAAGSKAEVVAEVIEDDATSTVAAEPSDDATSESTKSEGRRRRRGGRGRGSKSAATEASVDGSSGSSPTSSDSHVNELVPFLDFVERHPVGTEVTGTVDSYSSHGAYARVDEVLVYIPLRLMADPAPTSARKVLAIGDEVVAVVAGFVPDRRSIDAALPAMASAIETPAPAAADASDEQPAAPAPVKKRAVKKSVAKRRAAKKAPAKKAAAKRVAAKKAPAKKAAAKRVAAKKAPAKKAPAKRVAAKKTPAKQAAARKAPAKQAAARKATASTATTRKRSAAKKAATKRAAKKPAATRRAASS